MLNIVTPDIQIVGHTTYTDALHDGQILMQRDNDATDTGTLMELAGRGCYESWDKPNPATRSNADYLQKNILGKGHYSVLEQGVVSFRFTGISRSLTHELIRHRGISPSQLSQRFVDGTDMAVVMPPLIRDLAHPRADERRMKWFRSMERAYADFREEADFLRYDVKAPKKEAMQAARSYLPNAAETRMVATANYRTWIHVINMRDADGADAEIREVAQLLLAKLRVHEPAIFGHDAEQIWRTA